MQFVERQKFTSKWLWGTLLVVAGITYFQLFRALYYQLYLGQPYGDKPMGDYALMITIVLVTLLFGGLFWMFRSSELISSIDSDAIRYRFHPFQARTKMISWSEVASYEMSEFKAISQYGGWGVRMTSGGYAYIVEGNRGLKLLLRNGKSILIGTQKEEELKGFLREIGKEI